jgi:hypothetical protein
MTRTSNSVSARELQQVRGARRDRVKKGSGRGQPHPPRPSQTDAGISIALRNHGHLATYGSRLSFSASGLRPQRSRSPRQSLIFRNADANSGATSLSPWASPLHILEHRSAHARNASGKPMREGTKNIPDRGHHPRILIITWTDSAQVKHIKHIPGRTM